MKELSITVKIHYPKDTVLSVGVIKNLIELTIDRINKADKVDKADKADKVDKVKENNQEYHELQDY